MNTQYPIEHPTITDTQSLVAITVIIILYLQFINAMMCHNLSCVWGTNTVGEERVRDLWWVILCVNMARL